MEYEFYHHGIKGQKWGVRRFQNEDGSLTPAGREQYYTNGDSKRIYESLKNKGRIEKKPGSLFREKILDYSESEDLKEAGGYLKKQRDAVCKKGKGLQEAYRKEAMAYISDPKNENKVLNLTKKYYAEYDDLYSPDEYDVKFAVADLITEQFENKNKQALSDYYKMQRDYSDNASAIAKDIAGSYADEKVKVISEKTNFFGLKTKANAKYSSLLESTLEKIAGGYSWDFPRVEYDGDDLGGLSEMMGTSEQSLDKYCETLADKYNKQKG